MKASPSIRSFNAGEFSPLMEGRTDHPQYPASCRTMLNAVAAPQGPAICRSGTLYTVPVFDQTQDSALIPFVFSIEESYALEMANNLVRFVNEDGILIQAPGAMTITHTGPFKFQSATLEALGPIVGSQVAFSGFDPSYNLNGVVGNITSVVGSAPATYTVDTVFPALAVPGAGAVDVALVFAVVSPYAAADVEDVRFIQSFDQMWLLHKSYPSYRLSRFDTYNWTLVEIPFIDGPYLTPNVTATTLAFSANTGSVTVTASSIVGINNGAGFKASDVGRLIRVLESAAWAWLQITAFTDTQHVTATVMGANLAATGAVTTWRLGAWSATTGYPQTGCFYQDRLWIGGGVLFPDFFSASSSGLYDDMTPTQPDGTVLDTNAISGTLNSRKLAGIMWMAGNQLGLLIGTGSQEYSCAPAGGATTAVTPNNIVVTPVSSRGSAPLDPAVIDTATLFVERSGRVIREFSFVVIQGTFKSPSLSMFSSHMGARPFVRAAYAQQPFGIIWYLRADGNVVGLTYDRDEQIKGWHRHDFGGVVESICVIPQADNLQDCLWIIVNRNINGFDTRYIEKMTRFWDFELDISDAHFVDCAIKYSGTPIQTVYGLQHLEARGDIYGLIDGVACGPLTVTEGMVELPVAASNIVLGIGFESDVVTSRLENGAQDGTAQGKEKRINNLSLNLWESYGGQIGTYNSDTLQVEYEDIPYPLAEVNLLRSVALFNGILGTIIPQPGYDKDGSVYFRRVAEKPYPLNVISLLPQLDTQDR